MKPSVPPRLLYIHMAALGDAIMASPALRMLKQQLPDWRIDVLARRHATAYFKALPYIDNVVDFVDDRHVDRKRPWKLAGGAGELATLFQQLRNARYDCVIQWRGQLSDTVMSAWTGARHRVAAVQSLHRKSRLPVEKTRFLVTDLAPVDDSSAHLVQAMAAPASYFLKKIGRPAPENPNLSLDYPLRGQDHAEACKFLAEHGLSGDTRVACVSISAKTLVNSWPADRFAAVADYLQQQHGLRVVLNGLPMHREREAEIARLMSTQPIRSVGRIPFGGLCALLARSRLLVSLNTGISHIAAALHVPVVVLSGRDGASITPWGTPHRVVTKNSFYPQRHPNEREWPTLTRRIAVKDVTAAIDELLSETPCSP